jgi:hypothetical protein
MGTSSSPGAQVSRSLRDRACVRGGHVSFRHIISFERGGALLLKRPFVFFVFLFFANIANQLPGRTLGAAGVEWSEDSIMCLSLSSFSACSRCIHINRR